MVLVSIIVPVYNEEKYIAKLLDSLLSQTFTDFEVLIYDGGCTDSTISIARKYKFVKVFKNSKKKHVYAFNQGIFDATGKYVVILSGHAYIDKKFLEKGVSALDKYDGVGGIHSHVNVNFFSKVSSVLLSSMLTGGSGSRYSVLKKRLASTIVYGMYRKEVLVSNKFDESFVTGQDLELNLRLVSKGYKLLFDPAIKSYYYSRSSFSKFINQMFRYGFARGHLVRRGYKQWFAFVPLLFNIYLVSLLFMGSYWFIPLGLYSVLVFIDTIRSVIKNGIIGVFNVFIGIVHVILGIGVLFGLVIK